MSFRGSSWLARVSAIAAGLLLLGSCCPEPAPFNPDDPKLENARLEIVGANTFNLRYGGEAELVVRYVFEDGSPISGAPLDWEISGADGGSNLSARRTDTASDGISTNLLTARDTNADFSVRVTPPVGNSVTFLVNVSDTPLGSISIEMFYSGDQRFDRYTPYLFRGVNCGSLDPEALPTAERIGTPVTSIVDRPGWAGITPADDYVITVVADIAGEVAGFGCTVGVTVVANEETRVDVQILDFTPAVRFEGTYDLANIFDFGDGLPNSVDTALNILDELTDDQSLAGNPATEDWGQDPGAFVTDMAMRTTCHWECRAGEDYGSCSEDNHRLGDLRALYVENFTSWSGAEARFFSGCGVWEIAAEPAQNLVNAQIGTHVPEIVLRFLDAAGDLSRAIVRSRIGSILMLQPADEFGAVPFDHRLVTMEVRLRDLGGDEHFRTFNLRDAGVMELSRVGMATVSGDELLLPAHSFELHLGELVQYIYLRELLPLFGFRSTADMLMSWIDCPAIARSLYMRSTLLTEMQYRDACVAGINLAGSLIDDNIAGLVDAAATLTIAGQVRGHDISREGIAQSLGTLAEPGLWMGSWDEVGMGGDVSGTFTGRRR